METFSRTQRIKSRRANKVIPWHLSSKNIILSTSEFFMHYLTHWGRVTHICVGINTNIGSDNDLSPGRRQAIIWSNAGILLIGPLATNFSEILIEILTFSFKEMHLKVSSAKWRPSCLGLNVLKNVLLKIWSAKCCRFIVLGSMS